MSERDTGMRRVPFKALALVLIIGAVFVAGQFNLVARVREGLPDFETFKASCLANEKRIDEATAVFVDAIPFPLLFDTTRSAVITAGDAVYAGVSEIGWVLVCGRRTTDMAKIACVFTWIALICAAFTGFFGFLDGANDASLMRALLAMKGLPLWAVLLALLILPFEIASRLFTAFFQIVIGAFSFSLRRNKSGDSNA